MTLLKSLGFLRLALIGLALINILLRPAPETAVARSGIEIIPTLIAPAAAPILLMVILFEALMSKIRASDATGEESRKFSRIMWVEIATAAIMAIAWLPYFIALGK